MEEPIQNLESIDIIGEKLDGSVDLCIVVSGYLDATDHHEDLLRSKINSYLDLIYSKKWSDKYGEGNTRILIKAVEPPHKDIISLINSIKQYLFNYKIDLQLEYT